MLGDGQRALRPGHQCFAALNGASFSELSNSLISVNLSTGGNMAGGPTPGTGSFSATADPVISIDPTFQANNPGYVLIFSALSQPVPEPSTLVLLASGIVALGYSIFRRKVPLG